MKVGGIHGPDTETVGTGHVETPPDSYGVRDLAVGCLHVLAGSAKVYYPSSSPASPSRVVRIDRSPSWRGPVHSGMPIEVDWKRWEKAVYPVLSNPGFDVDLFIRDRSRIPDSSTRYLSMIEAALVRKLREEGFLPEDSG